MASLTTTSVGPPPGSDAMRTQLLHMVRGMDRPSVWCGVTDGRRPLCMQGGGTGGHPEGVWVVAMIAMLVVAVLQAHRLISGMASYAAMRTGGEHLLREFVIACMALSGLILFTRDLQLCRVYEGILKLVALVGIANLIVPCIWVVPPPAPHEEDQEVDGEEETFSGDKTKNS